MRIHVLKSLAFFVLALLLIASAAACTGNNGGQGNNTEVKEGIDLSEYSVIYPQSTTASFKNSVASFCKMLGDLKYAAESAGEGPEIVITDTLEASGQAHEWRVEIREKSIEIKGNDADAMMMGMKKLTGLFEDGRLKAEVGTVLTGGFGDEVRIFENLVTWELIEETVIDKPEGKSSSATLKYPSLIELCHQSDESKNGILLATGERWLDGHNCPIYRSTDGGSSFETVTFVEDTLHKNMRSAFAPCLFELPRAVGDMPAGTVILGSNCINSAWDEGYIVLFRSFDCGDTWEAFVVMAGGRRSNGTFGVWEPNFVVTDDGTFICYYSDETDGKHSQKLVYRLTKDGENWEKAVDVVALDNGGLRPGMPVVTRMGDGRYIMVYEIVGLAGNPVYCRYSDDALDWGDAADMGQLVRAGGKSLAATPWCSYADGIGGDDGMLVLTGWRMASGKSDTGSNIFVSFNNGKSWVSVPNFYSYKWSSDDDTWGYSVCTLLSSDGSTLYYMANPQSGRLKHTYTLYKIRVE